MVKIGAHVSRVGGLQKSIENALKIGANCMQIFGSSPRQWRVRFPSPREIAGYKDALKKSAIEPVFLHAPYLVNLASPDNVIWLKSVRALTGHLKIAEAIGAQGLIFHPGSGKGEVSHERALERAVRAMREVLKRVPGKSQLIIENTAGGGQKIGGSVEELAHLLNRVRSKRVKVCFDTAHAFEAGLIKEFIPSSIKRVFDEWARGVGLENTVALHVNDSKTRFNSHHDRHENIGQGYIGLKGFKHLAREQRIRDKPWIIETPGFDRKGPDKKNLDRLKACFENNGGRPH